MRFEFATATRIIFGKGTLQEAGREAAALGSHALVVTGANRDRATRMIELLEASGVKATVFQVDSEPTVDTALKGVTAARQFNCDLVIGIGGGAAIDAGKAIAALTANPGEPLDYLEVIGKGQSLSRPPLPYMAVPTTAGTGAEVTRNAVLASPEHRVKVSLRSPLMLPKLALVDPELTYSMPPEVTAMTGMDALTQVLEPFVSVKANPLTDALCREGMARAARSLRRAFEEPTDAAREDMSLASLFGGLALANAALGAVHGFAGPLGGMYPIPHGVACARLLPYVMETNIRALREREPDNPALARYAEVARILTGNPDATPEDGAAWVAELCEALKIPRLSQFGVASIDLPDIVEKSARASSMKGNPIKLTEAELTEILERAL
ncbi:MAG: iron-containing alcohol dehydrogenase [Chloroflexota bacterium]|nr:MAG: alcohol dehydrogenase [Chloroflexota bacterium]